MSTTLDQHGLLQSDYIEEVGQEGGETERFSRNTVKKVFQFTSLLSLVSVSANTPQTFKNYPPLLYITYLADWFCLLTFTFEFGIKIKKRGWFNAETGYFRYYCC